MNPAEVLIHRINVAEQHKRISEFEIAEAERQLEAVARIPGVVVANEVIEGLLPEARNRVLPRLNLTGRFAYLGRT
jgi:hypothetical protein